LLWQRKCEDALYSLLKLGARRPVRHLASVAMAKIISRGDSISIYSRASSLQGFLSDAKRSEPQRVAGWFKISLFFLGYGKLWYKFTSSILCKLIVNWIPPPINGYIFQCWNSLLAVCIYCSNCMRAAYFSGN